MSGNTSNDGTYEIDHHWRPIHTVATYHVWQTSSL